MVKKYVETYSSSNAAALYPEEKVFKINLVQYITNHTENSMKAVIYYKEL